MPLNRNSQNCIPSCISLTVYDIFRNLEKKKNMVSLIMLSADQLKTLKYLYNVMFRNLDYFIVSFTVFETFKELPPAVTFSY